MVGKFIVITQIFYNAQEIARSRQEKETISKSERDIVIKSMFNRLQGWKRSSIMEKYSEIASVLKENYGIDICERTVMRSLEIIIIMINAYAQL